MENIKKENIYNLIIIGSGPAGLAASIYASRYSIPHIIIGNIIGGQISETHKIDNYPGMENMSGMEFSQKWVKHTQKYGVKILPVLVKSIKPSLKNSFFELNLENKNILKAKTILLATGAKKRKLNISSKDKFIGKGVSYCATCDGFFYKDKVVGIIGGSDSAAGAALYLANIAQKVYLIYRKNHLRCEPYWLNLVKKNTKIEVVYNTNVIEFKGEENLQAVVLDKPYQNKKELKLDGIFIEIGSMPDFDYAQNLKLKTDEGGYIKIKKDGATSFEGVWAAGDITNGSDKFRQVITAAAEGAIATRSIYNWLEKNKK